MTYLMIHWYFHLFYVDISYYFNLMSIYDSSPLRTKSPDGYQMIEKNILISFILICYITSTYVTQHVIFFLRFLILRILNPSTIGDPRPAVSLLHLILILGDTRSRPQPTQHPNNRIIIYLSILCYFYVYVLRYYPLFVCKY